MTLPTASFHTTPASPLRASGRSLTRSLTRPLTRREWLAGAAALAAAGSARAAYPERPLRIIVPWAPGGSTDAIARALAQAMGDTLRQTVIVDNKPGASGQIGTDAAAKATPDGYTLAIVELPHAIAPAVIAKLPYDLLRDFTPITLLGTSPLVLFAGPEATDAKSFIRQAAAQSAPPAIAHSGSGSISHLVGELFAEATKVRFNMVPYKGSAPALTDVAAGLVAGHFATLASGSSLLGAGKLRALAVSSPKRLDHVPALRGVPTLSELGFRNLVLDQWWALVAPATTPIELIERLRADAITAMASPRVRERMQTLGIDSKGTTRDELRAFLRSETERWQNVARGVGLQPQ